MGYVKQKIDNPSDPTFNQLLAINEAGWIAGYFGSGATGHPNQGYVVGPDYAADDFYAENFPASAQTQVTGINDADLTVGFEVDAAGDSYGFIDQGGIFSIAVDPMAPNIGGVVTEQFLGVNDHGEVAGFYVADASGDDAGFVYSIAAETYTDVSIKDALSVTVTDVNNEGEVSGFYTSKYGDTFGFVKTPGQAKVKLTGPSGATDVQALGLNDTGLVVGSYVDGSGNTDGFLYNMATGVYKTFIKGNGTQTVINGVDDAGQLVGFYVDGAGNTDGMLLTPSTPSISLTTTTIDNSADPTFNQLLAINNTGVIAGYFGSGATGHPNQGYTVSAPYGQANFVNENFPGSVQTQVTGINNKGATVGFEIDAAGNSLGFVYRNGRYTAAIDPSAAALGGTINEQFLGINDLGQVAGFYSNSATGATTGFIYNSNNGKFRDLSVDGTTNITLTDINDKGEISGFVNGGSGFLFSDGTTTNISGGAGDSAVQVLGLNNEGVAVGSFQDSGGNTHGFVYTQSSGAFDAFDAQGAVGQTVLNGINDLGQAVGFYMDSAGNTHGLLATGLPGT